MKKHYKNCFDFKILTSGMSWLLDGLIPFPLKAT